jgi:hypothetical protein
LMAACKTCHEFASKKAECSAGSQVDVSSCSCNQGYQGDGETTCICIPGTYFKDKKCNSCKQCSPNAIKSKECTAGSTSDTVECTCNSGYYGDGITCSACKTCHPDAMMIQFCEVESTTDKVECVCNSGYYGNGFFCRYEKERHFVFAQIDCVFLLFVFFKF